MAHLKVPRFSEEVLCGAIPKMKITKFSHIINIWKNSEMASDFIHSAEVTVNMN